MKTKRDFVKESAHQLFHCNFDHNVDLKNVVLIKGNNLMQKCVECGLISESSTVNLSLGSFNIKSPFLKTFSYKVGYLKT